MGLEHALWKKKQWMISNDFDTFNQVKIRLPYSLYTPYASRFETVTQWDTTLIVSCYELWSSVPKNNLVREEDFGSLCFRIPAWPSSGPFFLHPALNLIARCHVMLTRFWCTFSNFEIQSLFHRQKPDLVNNSENNGFRRSSLNRMNFIGQCVSSTLRPQISLNCIWELTC